MAPAMSLLDITRASRVNPPSRFSLWVCKIVFGLSKLSEVIYLTTFGVSLLPPQNINQKKGQLSSHLHFSATVPPVGRNPVQRGGDFPPWRRQPSSPKNLPYPVCAGCTLKTRALISFPNKDQQNGSTGMDMNPNYMEMQWCLK